VLGLSKVYVQAKRYSAQNAVQRPEVQGFVGALSGRADGGVFITTSRFSSGAVEWVRTVPARIILIDGRRLAELMIEYGVGVQIERTYRVVQIDEDFFT
jgi:restriction system protein